MGCSQAVRHQTLTLALRWFESSHPSQKSVHVCVRIFTFSFFIESESTDFWYNVEKKGGVLCMNFAHCDTDEKYLTLHDCVADRAYFENGKLGFEFNDGFWISPDHPESNLSELVRTDFSKVEFKLEDGADYDVTIYIFKKNLFNKTIRIEWTIQKLLKSINCGKYKLEFLYQYIDYNSKMIECRLKFDKKPYHQECIMKISATETRYYWNNLREDRLW